MDYNMMLLGAGAGLGWGILGYFRRKAEEPKTEFAPKKFVKSVAVGISLGTYAGYTGNIGDLSILAATPIGEKILSIVNNLFEKIWGKI